MLKNKTIVVSTANRNKNRYQNLGYCISGETVEIKTEHLSDNSHIVVDVICAKCQKEYELMYAKYFQNISNYGFFTCKKCSYDKKKITNLERFGVENYAKLENYGEITKKIKKEKYGDENYNNNEKHKETCLERYGVDSHFKSEKFKFNSRKVKLEKYGDEFYTNTNKTKNTKLEKYGNENYVNINKKNKTILEKYGVDNYTKTQEFKIKLRHYHDNKTMERIPNIISINRDSDSIIILCDKGHKYDINIDLLGDRHDRRTTLCTICNPLNSNSSSGYEIQLQNFIKGNYFGSIEYNKRNIISPYEIDIYLPELKLGFEFNGLYWHSEKNVPQNYHLIKTDLFKEFGGKLIQIYEDDWIYKRKIVESKILNLLGKLEKISPIKCDLKEIDEELEKEFLNNNHLQGFIDSEIKIGLFHLNDLVSLMTFNKKYDSYELLRFCNKLDIIDSEVILFEFFKKKYSPTKVFSFSNRNWFHDEYERMGFESLDKTEPNMHYVFGNKKFCKREEINSKGKIYRIYDSGNLKYIYKNNQ